LFSLLGPVRTDIFIGRFEGHHFLGNPYISGQKVSFKPTENFEFDFSKITVFAGGGIPLTWHNFYKANFSVDDGSAASMPTCRESILAIDAAASISATASRAYASG
jgi:hypothetical protein